MGSSDDDSSDEEGQTAWLRSYLSLSWFFLAIFLIFFIRSYAKNKFFRWFNYATIYVCYGAALGIVVAVPIDVAYTIKARAAPVALISTYNNETDVLVGQYRTLYWMALILGVLMYWVEIYSSNGYVYLWDRFKDTSRRMAQDYFAMGVVGVGFIWILVATHSVPKDSDAVTTAVVSVSNTVGLAIIVICLGYALVAYPIKVWRSADLEAEVRLLKASAAQEFVTFKAAQLSLQQIVASSLLTMEAAKRQGGLFAEIDLLTSHLPEGMTSVVGGKIDAASTKNKECHFLGMKLCGSNNTTDTIGPSKGKNRINVKSREAPFITKHDLAALLNRLLKAKAKFFICNGRWERSKLRAFYIMDVTDAILEANEAKYEDGIENEDTQRSASELRWAPIRWTQDGSEGGQLAYQYHTYYLPNLIRVLALSCGCLSALTLLGEGSTIGNSYHTGMAVYSDAVHRENASVFGVTLFSMVTLGYMTFLLFWGMFQIKLLDMYDMLPNNNTTPKAMSFNARQVAKLCPPLVFNFLGMLYESGVHEGSWVKDNNDENYYLGFTRMYGNLLPENLGLRAVGRYAVVAILVVSALRLFNLFNRLLCLVGLDRYQFGTVINDSFKEKEMVEGERQLARHRDMQRRAAQRKIALKIKKPDGDSESGLLGIRLSSVRGANKGGKNASVKKKKRNNSIKDSESDKVSIMVREDDEDEAINEEDEVPSFRNLWGSRLFKVARDAVRNPLAQQVTTDDLDLEEPDPMVGWVQLKNSKTDSAGERCYAHLKAPGIINCFHDENAQLQYEADLVKNIHNQIKPVNVIDLTLSLYVSEERDEDNTIIVNYDDRQQRIYVKDNGIYKLWFDRVVAWQGYAIDPTLLAHQAAEDEADLLIGQKGANASIRKNKRMSAASALATIASLDFEDDFTGGRKSVQADSNDLTSNGGKEGGGGGGGISNFMKGKPKPVHTSSTMSLESTGEDAAPAPLEAWLEVLTTSSVRQETPMFESVSTDLKIDDNFSKKKKKPLYKRKPKFLKKMMKKNNSSKQTEMTSQEEENNDEDNDDIDLEDSSVNVIQNEIIGSELFEKRYVRLDQASKSLIFDTKKFSKYDVTKHKETRKDIRFVGKIEVFHDTAIENRSKNNDAAEEVDVENGLKFASCFFVVDEWKFKANSNEEALHWVDALEDWRDWLLLHAPF